MAAVGAGHVVIGLERHADADGDRLLPGVQVRRAVDLAAQEQAMHRCLELADQQHPRVRVEVRAGLSLLLRSLEPGHPSPSRLGAPPVGARRAPGFTRALQSCVTILSQTFAVRCSEEGLVAVEIVMPHLSDSMEEGTIVQWLVAEGDAVKRGRPAGRGRDRQGDASPTRLSTPGRSCGCTRPRVRASPSAR